MCGFFFNYGCNCVYGRQHLLHWPPPSIPADSWMPTQEDYLGVHLEKKLLAFTQCLAVHRAVHMSLPETLCHRAATLRAAGTSVATGERFPNANISHQGLRYKRVSSFSCQVPGHKRGVERQAQSERTTLHWFSEEDCG